MKKLIAVAVLIMPFLFSGCASIGRQKAVATQPQSVLAAFRSREFKNDSVNVVYLQKSTATADVVAVISISGEIGEEEDSSMIGNLKMMLRVAREDYRVKAVILKVQSPGGSVNASDLMWNEVMKFKKSGKPVVAFFNGMAASGGYYISVPADKIVATPETETGSIGVIMYVSDISGKLKKEGVKYTVIKSGANKDMLSPLGPPTKEAMEIMKKIIDSSYERFVQKVAQGRHMDSSIVRILADGRIYDAEQALKHKLIDQIGYIEDSFDVAKTLASVNDASLIELKSKKSAVPDFFAMLNGKSSMDIDRQCFPLRNGLYFLWKVSDCNLK
ncbi:MAG: signal peptide peptidase SppA [bacterium]|nr:signal peptide peptidase SppA [bacterium]